MGDVLIAATDTDICPARVPKGEARMLCAVSLLWIRSVFRVLLLSLLSVESEGRKVILEAEQCFRAPKIDDPESSR